MNKNNNSKSNSSVGSATKRSRTNKQSKRSATAKTAKRSAAVKTTTNAKRVTAKGATAPRATAKSAKRTASAKKISAKRTVNTARTSRSTSTVDYNRSVGSLSASMQSRITGIEKASITNNTQRVFVELVQRGADGSWLRADSFRTPNSASRIRDLRTDRFGSFEIECATAQQLGRTTNEKTLRQRYYRLVPSSVTLDRVSRIFEGVISSK